MSDLIFSFLSLVGVGYYVWLTRGLPTRPEVRPDLGSGDAWFGGILALLMLANVAASVGQTFEVNARVIVSGMLLYFCLVAMVLGFLVVRGRNPVALFGLNWPAWKTGLPFALVSLIAAAPVIYFVLMLTQHFLPGDDKPQEMVTFLMDHPELSNRLLIIFMAVVAAPIAEEVIFRGYLHGLLRKYGGRWCGIVVNSMVFAAIHNHIPSLPALFILAVALSLVYERTGSLWSTIFMHAVFNSTTVLVAILWPDLTTSP